MTYQESYRDRSDAAGTLFDDTMRSLPLEAVPFPEASRLNAPSPLLHPLRRRDYNAATESLGRDLETLPPSELSPSEQSVLESLKGGALSAYTTLGDCEQSAFLARLYAQAEASMTGLKRQEAATTYLENLEPDTLAGRYGLRNLDDAGRLRNAQTEAVSGQADALGKQLAGITRIGMKAVAGTALSADDITLLTSMAITPPQGKLVSIDTAEARIRTTVHREETFEHALEQSLTTDRHLRQDEKTPGQILEQIETSTLPPETKARLAAHARQYSQEQYQKLRSSPAIKTIGDMSPQTSLDALLDISGSISDFSERTENLLDAQRQEVTDFCEEAGDLNARLIMSHFVPDGVSETAREDAINAYAAFARSSGNDPRLLRAIGSQSPNDWMLNSESLRSGQRNIVFSAIDGICREDAGLSEAALGMKLAWAGKDRELAPNEVNLITAEHYLSRTMPELRASIAGTMGKGDSAYDGRMQNLMDQGDKELLKSMLAQRNLPPDRQYALVQAYLLADTVENHGEMRDTAAIAAEVGLEQQEIQAIQLYETEERRKFSESVAASAHDVWDPNTLENKVLNFAGRMIGRDISTEKLGWRAVDDVLKPADFAAAQRVEEALVRSRTGVSTAGLAGADGIDGGVDLGQTNMVKTIVQESRSFFGADAHTSLDAAGRALRAKNRQANYVPGQGGTLPAADVLADVEYRRLNITPDGSPNRHNAPEAFSILALDELYRQGAEAKTPAEAKRILDQITQVQTGFTAFTGRSRKTFDPLGMRMLDERTKLDSDSLDAQGRFLNTFNFSNQISQTWATRSDEDRMASFRWLCANNSRQFAQSQLPQRAVAALGLDKHAHELTDDPRAFEGNVRLNITRGLYGADSPPNASLQTLSQSLYDRYHAELGTEVAFEARVGDPLRKMSSSATEAIDDCAKAAILHSYLQQPGKPPVSFAAFADKVALGPSPARPNGSPEYQAAARELTSILGAVEFPTAADPRRRIRPLEGDKSALFAPLAIASAIADIKRPTKGAAEWLASEDRNAQTVDRVRMVSQAVGREQADALSEVFHGEQTQRLVDTLKPGDAISFDFEKRIAVNLSVSTPALKTAELGLKIGLEAGHELTMDMDESGAYSVTLGGSLGASIGATLSADAGLISAEASAELSGSAYRGLRCSFESKEKASAFLRGIMVSHDPEAHKQALLNASEISTITEIGGRFTLGAKIEPGEVVQETDAKLRKAQEILSERNTDGNILDAELSAQLAVGGKRKVERPAQNKSVVTTEFEASATVSAGLTIRTGVEQPPEGEVLTPLQDAAEQLDTQAEFEAEALFHAELEQSYTDDTLTASSLTRTFKIPAATGETALRERLEKVAGLMQGYDCANDALLEHIAALPLEEELELAITADMKPSAVFAYQNEPSTVRRALMATDRENYETARLTLTASKDAVTQAGIDFTEEDFEAAQENMESLSTAKEDIDTALDTAQDIVSDVSEGRIPSILQKSDPAPEDEQDENEDKTELGFESATFDSSATSSARTSLTYFAGAAQTAPEIRAQIDALTAPKPNEAVPTKTTVTPYTAKEAQKSATSSETGKATFDMNNEDIDRLTRLTDFHDPSDVTTHFAALQSIASFDPSQYDTSDLTDAQREAFDRRVMFADSVRPVVDLFTGKGVGYKDSANGANAEHNADTFEANLNSAVQSLREGAREFTHSTKPAPTTNVRAEIERITYGDLMASEREDHPQTRHASHHETQTSKTTGLSTSEAKPTREKG
jgi:hypothetical protein